MFASDASQMLSNIILVNSTTPDDKHLFSQRLKQMKDRQDKIEVVEA